MNEEVGVGGSILGRAAGQLDFSGALRRPFPVFLGAGVNLSLPSPFNLDMAPSEMWWG